MAGTVVITEELLGSFKSVKFEWTSSAGGAADGTTTAAGLNGKIDLLTTVPDGVAAPTDNYDVAVTDKNGVDVLVGAGANRDTANTEQVLGTSLGAVVNSQLILAVTNAGNAKEGTVYLYFR